MAGSHFRTLRLGIKCLLLHKLRSFLSMLGLLFGVASVISMLAVGEGANYEALQQIKSLGPTNLMVRSQKPPVSEEDSEGSSWRSFVYGLKYQDLARVRAMIPQAKNIVAVRESPKNLRRGVHWTSSVVVGTEPEFLEVMSLDVAEGRWLSPVDLERSENGVVLGAGAAEVLFPIENPIGGTLQAGSIRFSVIGVLEPTGRAASPGGVPVDECVFVPFTTSRMRFGDEVRRESTGSEERSRLELSEIKIELRSVDEVIPVSLLVAGILDIGERPQDDVKMIVPLELLRQREATARIFNLVLGSIAVISLLVGGIGIMNVMLATVTERTREIGIRRAVGAKKRHIVKQFLVETLALSGMGGLLGVVFGLITPWVITALTDNITIVQPAHVLLAFGISAATGVAFGIYPAWRAADMDPVTALRHE